MMKYFCDKCGRLINNREETFFRMNMFVRGKIEGNKEDYSDGLFVCIDCYNELISSVDFCKSCGNNNYSCDKCIHNKNVIV